MNNNCIYLSYFLDDRTPLYGGAKGIFVTPDRSIALGDTANTKRLTMHNHSGTHIDFPNHFFDDGKKSDAYDASFWVFSHPFFLEKNVAEAELISFTKSELQSIPKQTDFLIVKTGFGKFRMEEKYWQDNPGFSPSTAEQLRVQCPLIRILGMDLISLTSFRHREIGREAHRKFLGDNNILLIEDMDLSQLTKSPKQIICLPLLVKNFDGAPVTIIANI